MTARTPEDIDRLFAERMAAGDVDGVVALYEPGGGLVSFDGIVTTGPGPIREALARLAAMRPRMTMNLVRVVRSRRRLRARLQRLEDRPPWTPEGRPVTMEGRALEVSRQSAGRLVAVRAGRSVRARVGRARPSAGGAGPGAARVAARAAAAHRREAPAPTPRAARRPTRPT